MNKNKYKSRLKSPDNSLIKYFLRFLFGLWSLFFIHQLSYAGGDVWRGMFQGALDGFNESIREQAKEDSQRRLLEYQYELEKRRQENLQHQQRNADEQRRRSQVEADEQKRQQQIVLDQEQERQGVTGSGFFITTSGHIITNYHVIKDKTNYAIRNMEGRFYRAQVVSQDPKADLALLKVEGIFPALKIGNSDTVMKGQRVLAIGYPQISIQGNHP